MEDTKFNSYLKLPEEDKPKTEIIYSESFRAKITQNIGHGDDAKNSIIYLTLKYCFISGCIISIILTVNYWIEKYQNGTSTNEDFITYIIKGWGIVIPIITLALGYAFGQSKK